MKKKLTKEEVEEIFHDDHDDYELVKEGEWVSEGKYEFCDNTFKDADGTHWCVSASRAGSYFTDWEYGYEDEIIEVEEKEVTVKEWVAVED